MNEKSNVSNIIKSCIENVIISDKKEYSVKKSLVNDPNKKYIYNEFSLQHELGLCLIHELNIDYKGKYIVQFERNINSLDKAKNNYDKSEPEYVKSEIDIVITNITDSKEKYAIELKYHKKDGYGEVPNFIYECVKDMRFMKQIKQNKKFTKTFCAVVVEDKSVYSKDRKTNREMRPNYEHFKEDNKKEKIEKLVKEYGYTKDDDKYPWYVIKKKNNKKEYIRIDTREFYTEKGNTKIVEWKQIKDDAKYYIKEF